MPTIIIADSLTHDFASPAPEFTAVRVNVGPHEIARTMGAEAAYGRGPLPRFLQAAREARRNGADVHIILVRDMHDPDDPDQQPELLRHGLHAVRGTEGAAFVAPARALLDEAQVIETSSLALPANDLHATLARIFGRDVLDLDAEARDATVFVICGFHTDVRVASTAFKLRNEHGFRKVLVCPHLVGARDLQGQTASLQTGLPNALVTVVPSLEALAAQTGIAMPTLPGTGACRLLPASVATAISPEQQAVLEVLFLFDEAVSLTPLKGGFSGSLLLLAVPERGGHRQAPLVVKVGAHGSLVQEIAGYLRVRDLLGSHVPAMQAPVSVGSASGLRMTLASMEGRPTTLQRLFTDAADEDGLGTFLRVFDKALDLLSRDLYLNTRRRSKISPCQAVGLSGPKQLVWLRENLARIAPHADLEAETIDIGAGTVISNPLKTLPPLLAHIDYIDVDTALCHGDLNLANLLTDDTRAVWIIDWPWCDERPLEIDLAKMENDLCFVVDQGFTADDLPRWHALLAVLCTEETLPETPALEFARSDMRFARIYAAVRRLRLCYDGLKTDGWRELHALARLRFALHTLSFDARIGRGECALPQLTHALLAASLLIKRLAASPLYRSGQRDRHPSYPPRAIVAPEHADWNTPFDGYAPPTAPSRHAAAQDGDPPRIADEAGGRPRNPAGRTGLAGRGFFHQWGPNPAVDAVVTRVNHGRRAFEFALVKRADTGQWGLPGTFVAPGETNAQAFTRVVTEKLGLAVDAAGAEVIARVLVSDYRNTDHAWIESTVLLARLDEDEMPPLQGAHGGVTDVAWLLVDGALADQLFASHARIIAMCVRRLLESCADQVRREPLELLLDRL